MSAESDFRAALAAHAPLTALVGTRIAMHALAQSEPAPYVVFSAQHEPQLGLDGAVQLDRVSFSVECWAIGALASQQVADAVEAAIDAFDAASGSVSAVVLARSSGYDGELDLDASVLAIEWFTQ